MEVTASGVPRPRRNQLAQLVERLRGTWSGALNVGRTAAVVVEGPEADIDWAAAKLAVALQHGIPVVSADWLLDSQAHGFLLSAAPYRLEPPLLGRRSSAASTSAAAAPSRPAHTAATVNQAAAPAPLPLAQQHIAAPGSPAAVELEVLRGEAAQPRHSPLPPQPSPQAQAAVGTPTSKPLVARDELQEPPLSPAASSPLQHAGRASLELGVSSLQLLEQADGEAESGGHSAAALPPFSPSGSSGSSGEDAGLGGSPAWSAGSPEPPGRAADTGAVAATPAPASAGTDSDTKIARFLSRRPMVTLSRGSCLPRRCMLSDSICSSSSDGTSICSSLSGSGAGTAERMECARARQYSRRMGPAASGVIPCSAELPWDGEAGGQDEHASAVPPSPCSDASGGQRPGSPRAGSTAAVHSPGGTTAATVPSQQHSQGLLCMEPPVAEGGLPATTLVRLGPQLHRPPLRSTWEGLLERHGCGSCDSEGPSCAVTFHASAEALPEGGAALNFVAGDARHGALMLYDVKQDGRCVHALALVQAIYRWRDEVWMEHRYLLTREDLLERPHWAAALRGLEMRPGEVLLTVNAYHSPMHLVAGDFALGFPGRAQRARRGQQAQAGSSSAAAPAGSAQAVYMCRRGFDATAGAVVPLHRALEGFGVA